MGKTFYSNLIEMDSIIIELDKMGLLVTEKKHLIILVDKSIHNVILDTVLSELSESDKRVFVNKVTFEKNEKIWEFLSQKVDKIEDKIKKAIKDLKEELHEDIKEAHRIKNKK